MAAEKERKARVVDKWKKKQWFELVAPPEFDEKVIGETIAEKEKNLLNRVVSVNLGDLSGQRQRRHISILFKVVQVEGKRAKTAAIGHSISGGFLNRMIRRRMSKLEVTQQIDIAEGKKLKVKSVVLSVKKLSGKQETVLRNQIAERIEKMYKKKTALQTMQELFFGVTASKLFKPLAKIAPLKKIEVIESRLIE